MKRSAIHRTYDDEEQTKGRSDQQSRWSDQQMCQQFRYLQGQSSIFLNFFKNRSPMMQVRQALLQKWVQMLSALWSVPPHYLSHYLLWIDRAAQNKYRCLIRQPLRATRSIWSIFCFSQPILYLCHPYQIEHFSTTLNLRHHQDLI